MEVGWLFLCHWKTIIFLAKGGPTAGLSLMKQDSDFVTVKQFNHLFFTTTHSAQKIVKRCINDLRKERRNAMLNVNSGVNKIFANRIDINYKMIPLTTQQSF